MGLRGVIGGYDVVANIPGCFSILGTEESYPSGTWRKSPRGDSDLGSTLECCHMASMADQVRRIGL